MTRAALLAALWLLPAIAAARLDTTTPRRLDNGARLDWVPCWFEAGLGEDARCAHFFPSTPAGDGAAAPRVRLPVVVLRSVMPDTRDSPVLYLPPGPGPATGLSDAGLGAWWHWQGLARWPHDLVLYDVRGAGLAQPSLECPEIVDADRAGLAKALTAGDDLAAMQVAARACHARLRAAGIDVARFNTEAHVRDAGELLALLGGRDWNLWGVSYGTRLALHAAREFPERVRALIVDSAYPPEVNGLLAKPALFAAAARGREIEALMTRLARKPLALDVEKWPAQWRHTLAVNDYRLLWMLLIESYRPPDRSRAPRAVAGALAGDPAPLLPLAEAFVDLLLDRDYSHGTYYSTTCPEDLAGVSREAFLAEAKRHAAVARHLEPEWDRHTCRVWDAGTLPARFHAPVASRLPALFLSGAHDIVTPPAWAAAAARRFAGARHYTMPGSSHAVTWENDCAMGLAWEFLAEPRRPATPACWRDLTPSSARMNAR